MQRQKDYFRFQTVEVNLMQIYKNYLYMFSESITFSFFYKSCCKVLRTKIVLL